MYGMNVHKAIVDNNEERKQGSRFIMNEIMMKEELFSKKIILTGSESTDCS
jgi:hypothetical protein